MKKAVWITLVVYAVVAGILLWTAAEAPEEVRILSIRADRSRLISGDDETVDIPLYFSKKESFFVAQELVRSARLTDGEEEIAVSVLIADPEETASFRDRTYHFYRFRLGFPGFGAQGLQLSFESARLEIIYENEVTLSVDIGNLFLSFSSEDNPPFMDFFRLYGVMGESEGRRVLQGFVLGLDPQVVGLLCLTRISTGLSEACVDFGAITEWEGESHPTTGGDAVGDPHFSWVRTSAPADEGAWIVDSDVTLFVPLIHLDHPREISRFPLFVTYEYQGTEYTLVIDDFLFYTPGPLSEVPDGDVCETLHRH